MSKQTDKANHTYYTFRIENRLYIIRRSKTGYTTTFIKQGA